MIMVDLSWDVNRNDVQKLFCPSAQLPNKNNNHPFPPINLSLVLKAVSFTTFFQLSLLCLSDPQMPSYFFSKARPLFLSFANLLFWMQPYSTQFSPFLLFPILSPPSFFTCCFFPSLYFFVQFFFSFGAGHIKPGRSAANAWVQEQCTSWIHKSWRSRVQQFYFNIFRARGRVCETQILFPDTVSLSEVTKYSYKLLLLCQHD